MRDCHPALLNLFSFFSLPSLTNTLEGSSGVRQVTSMIHRLATSSARTGCPSKGPINVAPACLVFSMHFARVPFSFFLFFSFNILVFIFRIYQSKMQGELPSIAFWVHCMLFCQGLKENLPHYSWPGLFFFFIFPLLFFFFFPFSFLVFE